MPQKILLCVIPRGLANYQQALEESRISEFRQHAGEDLQSEVLLIAIAVGPTLEGTDLVVESLDESQWHLILHVAVGLDAVPVSFDHGKGGATSRPACLEPRAEKPRGSDYSLS